MNLHAGRLHEVWKHLVLAEVLRTERPARYAETHAVDPVSRLADDPERRYGIRHAAAALPAAAYLDVARPYLAFGTVPGAAAVALSVVPDADALLASPDPEVVADLRGWAARSGATGARAVVGQGAAAVERWLDQGTALVLVDPADASDRWDVGGEAGEDAAGLDLAAGIAEAGHGLVFCYQWDMPVDRGWALDAVGLFDLWQADLGVTLADGGTENAGELRYGTTPGTGCGVILANVDAAVARRVERLGEALVAAYEGVPLPDGRPGRLDLLVDLS